MTTMKTFEQGIFSLLVMTLLVQIASAECGYPDPPLVCGQGNPPLVCPSIWGYVTFNESKINGADVCVIVNSSSKGVYALATTTPYNNVEGMYFIQIPASSEDIITVTANNSINCGNNSKTLLTNTIRIDVNLTYLCITPVCGNGNCEGNENYTNCPTDCPVPSDCNYYCSSCDDCNLKINDANSGEKICLNQSIINEAGTCINASGFNNKILHCNGNTIDGNGNGYGIYINESTNNTIKNCTITDFANGIYALSSSNISIFNNKILNNTQSGIFSVFSTLILINNSACNNVNFDIYSINWMSSSGNNNSCNNADGWNDENKTGCSYCCDGSVPKIYYVDFDGDGYGNLTNNISTCNITVPAGYVNNSNDCDDNNASINPIATEICNEADDNCDGLIDPENSQGCTIYYYDNDNDGYGINTTAKLARCLCAPNATAKYNATQGGDCNDTNTNIHPGATDIPDNGIDEDCDGVYYTCNCTNCGDCNNKLANPLCSVVNLTTNIVNQDGRCITWPANNKIFDCKEYTIDGGAYEYGIYMEGKVNNTIKNCVVRDFRHGIYLVNSANNKILDSNTWSNKYDNIRLDNSQNNSIERTNATDSTDGYGISFRSSSTGNNLTNVRACSNADKEIYVESSSGGTGTNDVCDTNTNWNDTGYIGCSKFCNGSEGNKLCTDNDHDGYNTTGGSCGPIDCNDNNNQIYPGSSHSCGYCNGTTGTITYNSSTTVCRNSAGDCDTAEYCSGSSLDCPSDTFKPTTQICRASAGDCDSEEKCTGTTASCPSDTFKPTGTSCSDGAYCNGAETCNGAGNCQAGTAINCSSNNQPAIATCTNNPDNNPKTWDYKPAFTSTCDEATDSCTSSTQTLTHTCNITCGGCLSNSDCNDNDQGTIDTCNATTCECAHATSCTDNDHDGYNTTGGSCGPIDCNDNNNQIYPGSSHSCGYCNGTTGTITYNSSTTVCRNSAGDCDNAEYCSGSSLDCPSDTFKPTTQICRASAGDCDSEEKCTGTTAACPLDTFKPTGTSCSDGTYCNGAETCNGAGNCQAGTAINCSSNNQPAIATCTNNPDNNPKTWDYKPAFTSTCDEATDSCTSSTQTLTHTCNITCGGCLSNSDCNDNDPGTIDTCNATTCGCAHATSCTNNDHDGYNTTGGSCGPIDCNDNNNQIYPGSSHSCGYCNGTTGTITYNSSTTVCRNSAGDCDNAEYCSGSSLDCPSDTFKPTTQICRASAGDCDSEEKCTGTTAACPSDTFKPTGTSCSDGTYCNGAETCNGAGNCQAGTAINCSSNNQPAIATCTNNPDNNPKTWDYNPAFTSTCDEATDSCTSSTQTLTHTCNITCGGCLSNSDCNDNDPGTIDTCNATTCGCAHATSCTDNDHDGYNTTGGSCGPIDCNDTNNQIYLGANEIYNGIDDNCNNQIDEGFCDTSANCTSTQFCNTTNQCEAKKANDQSCSANEQCQSGNCMNDGKCHPSSWQCVNANTEYNSTHYCDGIHQIQAKKMDDNSCSQSYECQNGNCLNNTCRPIIWQCTNASTSINSTHYCNSAHQIVQKKTDDNTCSANYECETSNCARYVDCNTGVTINVDYICNKLCIVNKKCKPTGWECDIDKECTTGEGIGGNLYPCAFTPTTFYCGIDNKCHTIVLKTIISTRSDGVERNVHYSYWEVYSKGQGFEPNKNMTIYIVREGTTWTNNTNITPYHLTTPINVTTDANGNIPNTLLWKLPHWRDLQGGTTYYDIVVDENQDGKYQIGETVDGLNSYGFKVDPIWAANKKGEPKNEFKKGDDIYVNGDGLAVNSTNITIYIISNISVSNGTSICSAGNCLNVSQPVNAEVDEKGTFKNVVFCTKDLPVGAYKVLPDLNNNGVIDNEDILAMDDSDEIGFEIADDASATGKATDIFDLVEMLEYLSGEKNLTQLSNYNKLCYYNFVGSDCSDINLPDVFALIENIVIEG